MSNSNDQSNQDRDRAKDLEREVERNFPVEYACVNGSNQQVPFKRK